MAVSGLSDSMKKCLREMKKHGAAERTFYGPEGSALWKWTIAGNQAPPQQVCRGLQKGYFAPQGNDRHRVVLTDKGRKLAALAA